MVNNISHRRIIGLLIFYTKMKPHLKVSSKLQNVLMNQFTFVSVFISSKTYLLISRKRVHGDDMISICMLNYVINLFENLLILCQNIVFLHQNGKAQMSYQFTKKVTNNTLKTTKASLSFQFVAKFCVACSHILQITTSYLKINQVLSLLTLESIGLLAITHEIYCSFHKNYEVSGYYLTIELLTS